MIILTDVAAKLEEILNSAECPTDFQFVVKSQGYHLDTIADKKKGINKIPVFVEMVGGEYNPVPNLKQANFTYGVNIWFPIRFKETFYALNEYLEEVFVAKKLIIDGQSVLCNLGVAEYGEIVGVHLDQFEEWVEGTYEGAVHLFKNEHDISEKYMNMKFNIFITSLGEGFIFGNDVKYTLQMRFPQLKLTKMSVNYTYTSLGQETTVQLTANRNSEADETGVGYNYYAWDVTFFTTQTIYTRYIYLSQFSSTIKFYKKENNAFIEIDNFSYISYEETEIDTSQTVDLSEVLVWDSAGTGASITPVSEQLIGVDKYARNIENITNFNKSIVTYIKYSMFWDYFLTFYNKQELDQIGYKKFTKEYTFGSAIRKHDFYQIILSYNENISLGEPLSFTLTFGD